MRQHSLIAIPVWLFWACSSGGELRPDGGGAQPDAAGSPPTWWQDVQPIASQRCLLCHAQPPQFGAPMALVRYDDTQRVLPSGQRMHQVMAQRVRAAQSPMPPPGQLALTEAERSLFERWSAAGAPEGVPPTGQDAGSTLNDSGPPDAEVPDAVAGDAGSPRTRSWEIRAHAPSEPAAAFTLPIGETSYRCWGFTVPAGDAPRAYAVRFEPIVDNTRHLHHMLLFRKRNQPVGAGPFSCNAPAGDWDMVAGWAPGRMPSDLPAGTGSRAFGGDQYILQAHYDSVTEPGTTDASGMRLVLSAQEGLTEIGTLWHGLAWASSLQGSNVSKTHTCTIDRATTIFEVFPHMHQLGTRITLELLRSGAADWQLVTEVPAWSFEDQPNVLVPVGVQALAPGDQLRTTCWWDTQGRSVPFGEASSDEMCFNFISHYPNLPNANQRCWGLVP